MPPIMGMMATMASASFQLIVNSMIQAPIMMIREDAMETMACETNILIESTSAVRLVSNFEGLDCSI